MDSIVDPGYSRVDRRRPFSTPAPADSSTSARARRSPVYAVVSKPGANRSRGGRGSADGLDNIDAMTTEQGAVGPEPAASSSLYAQVSKPNRHRRAMSNDTTTSFSSDVRPPPPVSGFFLRSRWDTDSMRNNSDYATIDGVTEPTPQPLSSSSYPDYDVVGDPLNTDNDSTADYDPNYETVLVPTTTSSSVRTVSNNNVTNNNNNNNNSLPVVQTFGVAREIAPSARAATTTTVITMNGGVRTSESTIPDWVRPRPPLIREHIYQEVTSNSRRRGTSRPNSCQSDTLTTDL